MKRKRRLRSLTYAYAHGVEAATPQEHTLWKRARWTAVEPRATDGLEAGRKWRAKHDTAVA